MFIYAFIISFLFIPIILIIVLLYSSIHIFIVVGPNTYNENETIAKYEIMDGAPVRGNVNLSITVYLSILQRVNLSHLIDCIIVVSF